METLGTSRDGSLAFLVVGSVGILAILISGVCLMAVIKDSDLEYGEGDFGMEDETTGWLPFPGPGPSSVRLGAQSDFCFRRLNWLKKESRVARDCPMLSGRSSTG